jgi:predicted kinase
MYDVFGIIRMCEATLLNKLKKEKIICIHGTVCSGKTHYAKRLAKERSAVVLNHDEIGVPLFGIYPEKLDEHYEKIREYFFMKALEIMETGTPVILDWGFWNRADRKETTDYFAQHGYAVEWHGIEITEEALRRNVQMRYAEMAAGRSDVYPADDSLLAKAAEIIETPSKDEMDVWVRID